MLFDFVYINDIGNGFCSVTGCHNAFYGLVVRAASPGRFAFFYSASRQWFFGATPKDAVSDMFQSIGWSVPYIFDYSKYD